MIIATHKQKMVDCLYRLMTEFIDTHNFTDNTLSMTFGLKSQSATIGDHDMWCLVDNNNSLKGYPYAFMDEAEVLRFAGMMRQAARRFEDYDCHVICQTVLALEDNEPQYYIEITLTIK